jgi:exodeoxyribonuclease VII small subunit
MYTQENASWRKKMSTMDVPDDIKALSFEEALKELESLVRKLEEGRIPLKDAIVAYERGTHLRKHNEKLLAEAQLKIQHIVQQDENKISLQPSPLEEIVKP